MKTLIAIVLVAVVAAEQKREAEPSYGFSVGPRYGSRPAVAYSPYGRLPFARPHFIHKREADAEPRFLAQITGHGLVGYGYGNALSYLPGYDSPLRGMGIVYEYQTSEVYPGFGHSFQYKHGVVPSHSVDY